MSQWHTRFHPMTATTDPENAFTCPACGESLSVNESMTEAIVGKGCVSCGTDVPRAAFPPAGTTDPP